MSLPLLLPKKPPGKASVCCKGLTRNPPEQLTDRRWKEEHFSPLHFAQKKKPNLLLFVPELRCCSQISTNPRCSFRETSPRRQARLGLLRLPCLPRGQRGRWHPVLSGWAPAAVPRSATLHQSYRAQGIS